MNRRIDASSIEAFENSITVMEEDARQEDFEKFKEAYQALTMKIAISNVYTGAELDVNSEVKALFDGKTPKEIIGEFENGRRDSKPIENSVYVVKTKPQVINKEMRGK